MKRLRANEPETQSANIVASNLLQLQQVFPEAFRNGAVDFDVLKQLLGIAVQEGDERYGLQWHGKRRARQLALIPSSGTLRPCVQDSVEWDRTGNLIIEGDNLEVLKLLQKSYAGKVKLIYIDPPYNTGKDFVYPDNFHDSIRNYLEVTGQLDGGRKISSNTESSGRFHTDWLNMMYPRLKLARTLLREDGAIFMTIDDCEQPHLRLMCDEIFGPENFVSSIVWQKTYSAANNKQGIDAMHDYVVVYQKSDAFTVNLLPRTAKQDDAYGNADADPRGPWKAADSTRSEHRDYAYFAITTPSGKEVFPAKGRSWVFTKEELPGLLADRRLWFGKDGSSKPSLKLFLSEVKQGLVPTTWWTHEDAGHNDEGKKELKALMTEGVPFDTPKPTRLIQRIAMLATSAEASDIVLDFFAGSGTTGQAILELNARESGNRRVFLVQLQQPTGEANLTTIAEVTKERVRRAARRIREGNPGYSGDLGFRVFKLDTSNIREWEPDRNDLSRALEESIEHLKGDRTEGDILYELLLKLGLDLCVPIERKLIAGKPVDSIGNGALFACLADVIHREDAEPLAIGIAEWYTALAPACDAMCVFRDNAFVDDVAKTNLAASLSQNGLQHVRSI